MSKEKKPARKFRLSIGAIVLWSMLVLMVVGIVVLGGMKTPEEVVETVSEKAVTVRALVVEPRVIDDRVVLPGRVEADKSAQLAAEKNGRIVEVIVDRGDRVKAGQVLLRIDGRHWDVYGRQAAIELADAERDLARWEKLKGEGAVSSSEFDAMKRRRDLAEVAADEAAVHVSQCDIVSPIDGVVDARFVEPGEYLVEGQRVFTIVNRELLNVVVRVPEKDIGAVKQGMRLTMHSDALPGFDLVGRVNFIAQAGDATANTFAVELAVENPPSALRPGMVVDVDLLREVRQDAIVVPLAAVIPKRGDHVVFIVKDGLAVLRVVRIDAIVGADVVLASGLEPGVRLVVEGHRTLQDGVPVVIDSEMASAQE